MRGNLKPAGRDRVEALARESAPVCHLAELGDGLKPLGGISERERQPERAMQRGTFDRARW
jgi:hypothetical protein